MKQVAYWDLSEILDTRTDLDFSSIAYEKEVQETLKKANVITYEDGKCTLSESGLELNMEDIENILYEEDFELCFPSMAEVSCV